MRYPCLAVATCGTDLYRVGNVCTACPDDSTKATDAVDGQCVCPGTAAWHVLDAVTGKGRCGE